MVSEKIQKKKEIKKIEPNIKENNVIKLDASKKEPKIFEEKKNPGRKTLVLTKNRSGRKTNSIKRKDLKTKEIENQTLSPAVRKIVVEKKIDINSSKGSGKDGRVLKGDLN